MAFRRNARSITPAELRDDLHYDEKTGVFTWQVKRNGCVPGAVAGTVSGPDYYRNICVRGCLAAAHRLAWLYVKGEWPTDQLDHINGNRDDNRISNLREATQGENSFNRKRYSNNSSGVKGVYWNKSIGKWHAQIRANRKRHHVGFFPSVEAARAAYLAASARLHGEFGSAG